MTFGLMLEISIGLAITIALAIKIFLGRSDEKFIEKFKLDLNKLSK